MRNIFKIGFVSFTLQFIHLILVQAILRKLALVFPVDFKSYATVLSIQFFSFAVAISLMSYLRKHPRRYRILLIILALKYTAAVTIGLAVPGLIAISAIFFALAGVEYALLFAFSESEEKSTPVRLNIFIYAGSALGLLVGEKIFFKSFSLLTIVSCLSLLGLAIAVAQQMQAKARSVKLIPLESPDPRSLFGLILAFCSGFLLFATIMISYRLLKLYLRDTADISAEITAISMLIGACVSFAMTKLQSISQRTLYRTAALSLVCGSVIFTFVAQRLPRFAFLPREIFIALLLFGGSAIGASLFNLALSVAQRNKSQVNKILAANSWGSLVGALLFGVLLLPELQATRSFLILVIVFAALIILATVLMIKQSQRIFCTVAFAAIGILATIFLVNSAKNTEWFNTQIEKQIAKLLKNETIESVVETPADIWVLTSQRLAEVPVSHRLVNNAHSMSGTMFVNKRYMKLMAYLAWLYSVGSAHGLNIGYGTGLSAQGVLELKEVKQLDVIDVTNQILPLTKIIYDHENSPDPLRDARLKFFIGGARNFLKNSTQKYDFITGEPPPPANSNVAYLYTAEFFQLVKSRLKEGGAFSYWLPLNSVSKNAAYQILHTFCDTFEECDLFAGTETNLIMIGHGTATARPPRSAEKFAKLLETKFSNDTALFSPEQLFSLFVGSKMRLRLNYEKYRKITDNFAYIEEDFPRPASSYSSFFDPYRSGQGAAAYKAASDILGHLKLKDSAIQFDHAFTIETALEPNAAAQAIVKAYKENANPLVIAWLFGLDANLERAISIAALPDNHSLMIMRQVVRHLQARDIAAAYKTMRKYPLENRFEPLLKQILTVLDMLEKSGEFVQSF